METLVVHAVSLESAQGLLGCLSGFRAKLVEAENGRYGVQVTLAGDGEIVAVLNALAEHVSQRGDGPARLELDGHSYTLPAPPGLDSSAGEDGQDGPEPHREAVGFDG